MKTFQEIFDKIIEKKQPDFTITIKDGKDTSKAYDALKRNKIKFNDVGAAVFTFKKEDQWDKAMNILDDIDVDFEFDG